MVLRRHFRGGKGRLASYNYVDLVTGRSYNKLYIGTASGDDAVVGYVASFQAFDSNDFSTEQSCSAADWVQKTDFDFDLIVNRPFTISGTFIASFSMGAKKNTQTTEVRVWVRVRKYSGTTETELALGKSEEESTTDTNGSGWRKAVTDEISNTGFKAGDKLRITVELWGKANAGWVYMSHDPGNTDTPASGNVGLDALDTDFIIFLPFRVYD